ncbi:MAG: hypothetical protein ACFFAE_11730 [Candidatus Hodarchaeota archaeon]
MIIKNLWIISKVGMCYYDYNAPFSDYQIDEILFSGLVAGLSTFAESLSVENKTIEYLKMGEDELYFETIDSTIVAAIVTTGDGKLQPFSIHVMLQFIGTKFVDMYYEEIDDMFFEWADIKSQFTKEIKNFLLDQDLLEDIKREQFQNLFNEAIMGNIPLDLLHWRGIQLFANSSPEVLSNSLKLITNLQDVASSLISDALLEAKVLDVLRRLLKDLSTKIFDQTPRKLLLFCKDVDIFKSLYKALLAREILAIHCPTFEYLQGVIETWQDPNSYDILIIDTHVSTKDIRALHNMEMIDDTKIIMIVNKIPRPPRGRLIQKKPISFIVQENISDFDLNTPLVDYLLTCLVHE